MLQFGHLTDIVHLQTNPAIYDHQYQKAYRFLWDQMKYLCFIEIYALVNK